MIPLQPARVAPTNSDFITKIQTMGNFQWSEADANMSLKDWAFCELVASGAPLKLLVTLLTPSVKKEDVKQAFQEAIQAKGKNEKWTAISFLLLTQTDWSCKLGAIGGTFKKGLPIDPKAKLLLCFKTAMIIALNDVINAIKQKQSRDQRFLDNPRVPKIFVRQNAASIYFLPKLCSLAKELDLRETSLLSLSNLATQGERHCASLHGVQTRCRKTVNDNFEAALQPMIRKCERAFAEQEKRLIQLYPKSEEVASLKFYISEVKSSFFKLEMDQRSAKPIDLINLLCTLDVNAKAYPAIPPEVLFRVFVNSAVEILTKQNQGSKEKKKKCSCCNLFDHHDDDYIDTTTTQHLIDTLSLCQLLMGNIKADLNVRKRLEGGFSPQPHEWEEMEEAEEVADSITSTNTPVALTPSTESSDKDFDETSDKALAPLPLLLASLKLPECEKDKAFPLILRFASQMLNTGSRLQNTYQESLSHVHLAHHGLQVLTQALFQGDLNGVIATIPVLIMDWHVQAEQLANFKIRLQEKPEVRGHSLVELFKQSDDWKELPPNLQVYLTELDQALLWSRYPYSSMDRLRKEKPPQALSCLLLAADALHKEALMPLQLEQLMTFILRAQQNSLQLFLQCSPLKNRSDELASIIELFSPKGWVERHWQEGMRLALKGKPEVRTEAKSFQLIEKLLKFTHPQRIVECKVRAALQDARHHLERLLVHRRLAAHSPLGAWHARNVMHIQWAIEQIYMARLFLQEPNAHFEHNFEELQICLGDTQEESLKKIREFNWGTGIHHPWQKRTQNPHFQTLIQAVETDAANFGLEFFDETPVPSKSREFYVQLAGTLDQAFFQIHRLLVVLAQEMETAMLPPEATVKILP